MTTALPATTSVGPREKSEDATRTSLLVTEVEVVRRGIVEVDGPLDEPEAKSAGVKVEIPLRITGDAGDMMDTGSTEAHRTDSCLALLRILALVRAGPGRSAFSPVPAFVLL